MYYNTAVLMGENGYYYHLYNEYKCLLVNVTIISFILIFFCTPSHSTPSQPVLYLSIYKSNFYLG